MHFEIEAPTTSPKEFGYDRECRTAMRPAFESLVEAASKAGWDKERLTYELMYLASEMIGEFRKAG